MSSQTPPELTMDIEDFALLCRESLPAAYEVARQLGMDRGKPSMQSSEAVYRHCKRHFLGSTEERFVLLVLDGKHRMLSDHLISMGTVTTCLVHPREVMRKVLLQPGAAAFVVAHNHPSGDPEPSVEDKAVTRRLLACGSTFGIPLLDHVVCGHTTWASLRTHMTFK